MKIITRRVALIVGSAACLSTSLFAEIASSPYVTGITMNKDQAVVTWTNGRPTFQLQSRSPVR